MFNRYSVLPGFGPAADPLLFRQKWTKPLTPRPATLQGTDANIWSAGQLAPLRQGPPIDESVRPFGLTEGVDNFRGEMRQPTFYGILFNLKGIAVVCEGRLGEIDRRGPFKKPVEELFIQ